MKDPWSRLLGFLALGIALFSASLFFLGGRDRIPASLAEEIRLYLTVREIIREQYVAPVKDEDLLRNALKGMVAGLDSYSRYYDSRERRELDSENAGEFVGIGIVIETSQPPLTVLFPQPSSPAEQAGIRVGDRIVAVDGASLEGLSLEAARQKIRGPEGSLVRLKLQPADGGEATEISLARKALADPSVFHAEILDARAGIGYLWISNFTERTLSEFDAAVERLRGQGMKSLILDLRFNPGGVLEAAVGLVNRFLCDGVIVSTEGRVEQYSREHRANPGACSLAGTPLALLINGESASASEVVAGAVQDLKLGTLLGSRSYGKGVVQSLKSLGEEGLVKLTTSYYYTPSRRNFERELSGGREGGIKPDVEIAVPRASEDALRRAANRFDTPEIYREAVEELRKKLGISNPWPADPARDAAVEALR